MNAAVRGLILSVVLSMVFVQVPAEADEQSAVPRIGVLVPPLANSPYEAGLREGLRELGYTDGKNISIEWRRSTGTEGELQSIASELVRAKVDVIVVYGTPAARGALRASATIPVVFLSGDPVASGIATSIARPGGNATGVSGVLTELTAKRLELLCQVAPRARRIAYLTNSSNPAAAPQREAAQKAARTLGVQLVYLDARNADELTSALGAISRSAASGVLISGDALLHANKPRIAQAVRKARLPSVSPYKDYHEEGVLMSYGPNLIAVGRKLAVYVDKILKGARPADLPIEEMSTYELVINLRVAKEIGISVPQALLLRADEVIR
jgi:putative ABC transport system substrate-binding protein